MQQDPEPRVAEASPAPADRGAGPVPLSRWPQRLIDWLWLYRLALGKPALLEGDPGQGKSLITLDLCARVTTGRPMPDGSAGLGPANVILLNAEDNLEDTVRPRLVALGADLDRVYPATRLTGRFDEPLRFPSCAPALDRHLP